MANRSAEDYRTQIDAFVARFGDERDLQLDPLDADGVTRVQRGSAVVWIHCLAEQGVLLLLSRVMKVPSSRREDLYRRLLELSFVATGDAAFAIDANTDAVYVRALRPLDGLDYEEFETLVHTVASVADEWDDKLAAEFGEPPA
ncbi:MAG: Tir chaperone family protein [Deltaproteobacteria bacterium]|nr:MAG: Tir chaperone family protein [Deltaproteobacteria bacterium]